MAGGIRWFVLQCIVLVACVALWAAQAQSPARQVNPPPAQQPLISEDGMRIFQLGQQCMGQNNPAYALAHEDLDARARNEAAGHAMDCFKQTTQRYPKYAEGWVWLGIAYTERLHYSKRTVHGDIDRSASDIAQGLQAFRTAYECASDNLLCLTYYSEALMTYREDFDTARKIWEKYLPIAKTDMQRVTALTQLARACLNKGYFGKARKTLSDAEIKEQFLAADTYTEQAEKICPNAPAVKSMVTLLQQYRAALCGK